MMISNSIQELFDGTLGDEQTAELLHSLSVSPEKRADFRHYMALQGLMQRDRAASELDSDEDRAIWGVLAGLGAATTVGGAAANYAGGFAKVLGFVAIGIGGYLLGSFTDIFGTSRSTAVNPPAVVAPASPITDARPPVPAANAPASSSIPHTPLPAAQSTPASSTASGSTSSIGAATAVPKVIYKDRIVYLERPAQASAATNTARTDNGGANNSGPNSSTASLAAQNVNPDATAKSAALGSDSINSPSSASGGTQNNAQSTTSPRATEPAKAQPTDSAARASNTVAHGISAPSIDPAEAFRRPDDPATPEQKPAVSALWSNGFELSYGEYVGMLSGEIVADEMAEHDPYYSSRHLDITYRAFNGRFGLGARIGYGTFSRVSLDMERDIRRNLAGEIVRADSMYRVSVQPRKQTLTEFFMNYRIPFMNNLGVGLEGLWGRSPVHTKAGVSVVVHWLLSEHLGLQGGGGLSRYWYSYVGEQREQILRDGGDGTSISDKATDSYAGTSFEARYGIFYHF